MLVADNRYWLVTIDGRAVAELPRTVLAPTVNATAGGYGACMTAIRAYHRNPAGQTVDLYRGAR